MTLTINTGTENITTDTIKEKSIEAVIRYAVTNEQHHCIVMNDCINFISVTNDIEAVIEYVQLNKDFDSIVVNSFDDYNELQEYLSVYFEV
ncbi:MAG: hypothetical protein IPN10_02985 [Saprospiraceae bacterium]|nr:hypothetical protein [Saprospiraceae bacterium]